MPHARQILGAAGERVAEQFLRRLRYHVVARNYRCAVGEIDLVALDGTTVVFVEVKTRSHAASGTPFEAVDSRKQRRIQRAAQYYLVEHHLVDRNARFDVVGIWLESGAPRCELIRNAFDYTA